MQHGPMTDDRTGEAPSEWDPARDNEGDWKREILIGGLGLQVLAVVIAFVAHMWVLLPMTAYTTGHILIGLNFFESRFGHWLTTRAGFDTIAMGVLTGGAIVWAVMKHGDSRPLLAIAVAAVGWPFVVREIRQQSRATKDRGLR